MSTNADVIEQGLHAWTGGDLDALEAVLDPQATLRAVDPGPWDCTDRAQIMRLLRHRQAERGDQPPYPVHVTRLDENTYLVSSDSPDGTQSFPVATRVTVTDGKVTAMQQYRPDTEQATRG